MVKAKSIRSKRRVAEHGEVFTGEREVKAMCDLVKRETECLASHFLEPACGHGNFLAEILKRKLAAADPADFKNSSLRALASIYGIDLLKDNVLECQRRLFSIWEAAYNENYGKNANGRCQAAAKDILKRNILCGDFLTAESADGAPLICTEWLFDDSGGLKRREFPLKRPPFEFDVIIGNPPYHLSDGGGTGASAVPLYQKFVVQAKNMRPRYLTMIIPARWYAGGKGLASFRRAMLNDRRIRSLHDYFDASVCFPGIDLSGGACYFLWDRDNEGDCRVVSNLTEQSSVAVRPLLVKGHDTFIRFNEAIPILDKVKRRNLPSFAEKVSPRRPFGLASSLRVKDCGGAGYVKVYAYPKNGYIPESLVKRNLDWIDQYKVLLAKAYGERGDFPYQVTARPFLAEPGSCCSETYLVLHTSGEARECENVISYLTTRFFRFLVLLKKNTQNTSRQVYSLAPVPDFSKKWTDEQLYAEFGLTKEEISFIESLVRPRH